MKTWYFFRREDGHFDGRSLSATSADALSLNTPEGFGAMEGVTDWQSQRVDISTGALMDYQPPPPDADHVWIEDDEHGQRVRRWVLSQSAAERRRREAEIRAELATLDARMIRPLAERDDEGEEADEARAIIDALKKQKASLRAELRGLNVR